MPFIKLKFQPGVDKEGTDYENTIGWFDSDKVRFRQGSPESIGGWSIFNRSTFIGTCRALLPWTATNGENQLGLGTHTKLYVEVGGLYFDLTPIRASSTINTNPFSITAASAEVTVTDTAHGAIAGDYVTYSGATSSDGTLTATVMNAEYVIDSITDDDTYVVTMSAAATGTDATEGGASVVAAYQLNVGLDTAVVGTGWGADTWGSETWGEASTLYNVTTQLRLWSLDNFGEDMVANVRNGDIYYWDKSVGTGTRAVTLASLSGATGAPTIARKVLVAPESRHLIALACDPEDDVGTQDTMLIRWADAEGVIDWTPDTDNTAGSIRLNIGSEIITGLVTKRDILIWTDNALNILAYTGAPFFFGTRLISSNTSIISPNAAIEVDEITYWMGRDSFYLYDGTVKTLPCALRDHVFSNINMDQLQKTHVGINRGDSEVTWYYATTTDEIDRYVTYNFAQNIWYPGTMVRTAYIDRGFNSHPLAANTDGKLYNHEIGCDDGTTTPATAINAYVESSIFEPFPGEGYQYAFVDRLIPDVTFGGSSAANPAVTITLTPRNYPGSSTGTADATTVTRSSTTPVEQFTKEASIRVRGRGLVYRIEKTLTGVFWRDGTPRLQVRKDGRN
ncbi:MAG: hypothetical protein HOE83_11250 [Alphaproteobacteria bacterium]|jgi:hypothetical protein|nr:hypothetical protein [Alphaproteobacteria bacterium]